MSPVNKIRRLNSNFKSNYIVKLRVYTCDNAHCSFNEFVRDLRFAPIDVTPITHNNTRIQSNFTVHL